MSTTIRKNKKKPNWVTGKIAEELFRHLEAEKRSTRSKRVEDILGLLSRLGANKRDWTAFNQLREPLSRYEWHYGLTLSNSGLQARLEFTKRMSEDSEWEYKAVRFLLSLVPHQIDRLRRCAFGGCKGWFFAENRSDQEFCKRGACRQNYYDDDPVRREQKRETMRENRRWHQEQDRRAKAKLKAKKK